MTILGVPVFFSAFLPYYINAKNKKEKLFKNFFKKVKLFDPPP